MLRANSDPDPQPTTAPRPTRDRLITATMEQFRLGGYHGTGIKSILTAAHAPYGSLYHFFPGGKRELAAAAIETSGQAYRELVELYFPPDGDLVGATRSFFAGAADVLEATDWIDGCPLARIALETAQESERLRLSALAAFESWLVVLIERLVDAGVDPESARALSVQLFCLVEGAFLLARVAHDREALDAAGAGAAALVASAIASRDQELAASS
jgi:TetR/AcrR family transcriptional regulator, lmrAB and yxaGH operons repressor